MIYDIFYDREGTIMKRMILSYMGVFAGLAAAAFGIVAFVLPSGILIGSSTGVGRVIDYLFDIPVSYTVFAFNGILFLTGWIALGRKFAASIVISTFAYPMFMNLFERTVFAEGITEDPMLAAVYGGVLIGMGMGLVIKCGASTGGTDILAIILNRKLGISVGLPMYLIDGAILLSQVFFAESADAVLLGIGLTFLYSMVADKVVMAGGSAVQLLVVSREYETIRRRLVESIVGNTVFYGETGYHGKRQDTLLCVISARELNKVQREILSVDPEAFITISSVKEVKGRGFSFEYGLAKKLRKEKEKKAA